MAALIDAHRFGQDTSSHLSRPGLSRQEVVERTFQTLLQAHTQLNAPIRASLAEEGLVLSHVMLLKTLIIRGEVTATELAEAMLLTNGAITALLKKLEAGGLITRTRKEEDRRLVHVKATDKAKRRFERLQAATALELTEAFHGWAVQDIEKLRDLLTRLTMDTK